MNDDRLQKVEELFHAALLLDRNQRDEFLSQSDADAETIAQVHSLLRAYDEAGDFLDDGPALHDSVFGASPESLLGQQIAHFKILSLLGSGGMGDVYLAEDTRLRRRVAIKLLRAGSLKAGQGHRRLLREARAAAHLEHPNICSIYEIREEADRAFIIMQYVEGETLSSRIKARRLDLSESLDIAIQIAEALAEAHRSGIIHRDIKPQNVIINRQGHVKVLDFGLAKVIGHDQKTGAVAAFDSLVTEENMIVGTPMYMSPEQARGARLDPRSDLFSLAVLLFECVTGRQPFSGDSLAEALANVIHFVPEPASTFNPAVPPQLDTVLAKALAKEAVKRYDSVGDLLAELRRVRSLLPADVEAQHSPPRSRLLPRIAARLSSQFRRSGRWKVAAMAALVLLPVLWLAFRLWPASADRPPLEARQWYESGVSAISWAAYYQATRALERAVKLDNRFTLAHARLAEAWSELDYTERAKDELLLATSLIPKGETLAPADSLYLDALVATSRRDFRGAIEIYQKVADQAPASEKARAYLDLGRAREKNEEAGMALESYQQALKYDSRYAPAYLRLGSLYARQQDLKNAVEAFNAAEAIYQDLGNMEGVAEVLYRRGALFDGVNRSAEARGQLEKALNIAETLASRHQQIKTMLQLSSVYYTEGRTARAREIATQAIELARDEHLENLTASGLIELGNSSFGHGEYEEAKQYFRQAIEFAAQSQGRNNEARARLSLGSLLMQQNDADQALPLIEQAMTFYQQGGFRKEMVQAVSLLGRGYGQRGDYEAALRAYQQQLDLAEQAGDQSQVALAHLGLGSVLGFFQERYTEALSHFDESYKIDVAIGARAYVGYDLTSRGGMLWLVGRYEEAQSAFAQAYAIAQRPDASDKYLMAWITLLKARMAASRERLDVAQASAQQALALSNAQFKDIAAQAKSTLGLIQSLAGQAARGRLLCEVAVDEAGGLRNPRYTAEAGLALSEALLAGGDARQALERATQAQASFARFGQPVSEWQAWVIAARAAQRAGDAQAAAQYATHALELLPSLEQRWGSEAYNGFLTRPDVQHRRQQLDQLLAAHQ